MTVICDGCYLLGNHEGIKPYDHHELCSECRDRVEAFIQVQIKKRNEIAINGTDLKLK